jgi:hypothetical protein
MTLLEEVRRVACPFHGENCRCVGLTAWGYAVWNCGSWLSTSGPRMTWELHALRRSEKVTP